MTGILFKELFCSLPFVDEGGDASDWGKQKWNRW